MTSHIHSIKQWFWRGAKLVLIAAVIGGLVYWAKFTPVPVKEHRIERGQIVAEVMGTGTLEARVRVTVSPKISGRIERILVDQGDHVSQGDPLFQLDDEELKQQVEMAQATLEAAEAAAVRVQADESRAAAVLALARSEHARAERLIETNAFSQSDLDKAVETLAVSESGLARVEASILESKKGILTAEKTLAYQRARLAETNITAPFDGLVVKRYRDPGDVVVPGRPVLSLVSLEELWISAWVDETEMDGIEVGQSARIIFRSEPERSYLGKVTRLGKETDRETREFIVDVGILQLPKHWAIGQRAEVYIEINRKKDVVLLPASFVRWHDGAPGVFINRNGKAAWRSTECGIRSPEMIEVIGGVRDGDIVIAPQGPKAMLTEGKGITAP